MIKEKGRVRNNFVIQASILAVAGIISRIIGLLYRSPLHQVIGDVGLGFYQSAYTFYTIILLISSYSIPAAISKVIAQKLAVQEYRNAHRIFKCSLLYVLIVGGVASLVLFFGAGFFVEEQAIPVLRVFAPTIFVYGVLGVLRGYFQAHSSMLQTSISQIVEQIVNAVVSVGAAYLLIRYSMGTMQVPADEAGQIKRGIYGAMGSATGTGMGVLLALVVMVAVYGLHRRSIRKRVQLDTKHRVEGYKKIFKTITLTVTPFIFSTAIYNLSSSVNTKIFTDLYKSWADMTTLSVQSIWGVFSGQALTISNIPIAFASAMATAMIPSIATLMAAGNLDGAKRKIGIATKVTMIISIPCAVGMLCLAKPITSLLFSDSEEVLSMAGRLLMALSLSVIFYALSTLNSSILQGAGKIYKPIINAGIALGVQTVVALDLLYFTKLGIYSIVIANTVYSGIMCVLNQRSTKKALGYKQEVRKTFLIPGVSAFIMGVASYGVYELLYTLVHSRRIAVIPAICVAVVVYFIALIALRGVEEEELMHLPKGSVVVKCAKKLHMM